MAIAGSLVWIRTTRGTLVPEKWPLEIAKGHTEGKQIVARHELTEGEYELKLAILEQRYPAPETTP